MKRKRSWGHRLRKEKTELNDPSISAHELDDEEERFIHKLELQRKLLTALVGDESMDPQGRLSDSP